MLFLKTVDGINLLTTRKRFEESMQAIQCMIHDQSESYFLVVKVCFIYSDNCRVLEMPAEKRREVEL